MRKSFLKKTERLRNTKKMTMNKSAKNQRSSRRSNADRSIRYGKMSLKWALYGAAVFAVIGSFVGCLTAPDEIWDSKGCLTVECEKTRMHRAGEEYDIPTSKVNDAKTYGYYVSGVRRKATASEKSSIENERFLYGALLGGLSGLQIGAAGPLLLSSWFFFLLMIEQLMSAFRLAPSKHNIRIKREK